MNACRYGLIAIVLLGLPGCSSGPALNAHIETLNNEYRQLEDEYYALEGDNQQLSLEFKRLEKHVENMGGDPDNAGDFLRRTPARQRSTPRPSIDLEPPTIEFPSPDSPPAAAPPASAPPGPALMPDLQPAPRPSSLRKPETELPGPPAELPSPPKLPETPSAPELIDPRVTHLHLNPTLTGGNDFDQQPGDDGISILIEPRNRHDQYVPQAGAVSIVVIDPAQPNESARIARWDFDLSATQQKLQSSRAADGIHLELPWPAKAPAHNRLKLFVRYETADGRKLQTDREIFVALPGEISQRWTPRAAVADAATADASPQTPAQPPATVAVKEPAPEPAKPASAAPSKAKLIVPPPALGDRPLEVKRSPGWSPYR
jgi:hypothetical protein